ncbi:hypothetical protein EKO04_006273 [Ascochyta lentis]|uniref:NACHT domain-containing protein n=1 Tax=Ascochyta lentis TaxID=205686 RepID=A0A8H7J338_9PLEO|nr:hypothetical protein EKO04_006273 [Ascochyta lentis]
MTTSVLVASAGKAGRLKPELRLAEAVSQFRLSLSNEQKTILDAEVSTAIRSAPNASHVMRFTAEFNRCVAAKAKGRCYGPRLASFLQGVQQLAALGDVIVGGSQNIVACGVWSLVRMSLLAIASISTYLEALSSLFMEIGRTSPRHQAIAILYPRSESLRTALNEYFIVVVNLCKRIVKFSRKSSLQRLAAGLSIDSLKPFRSDLDQWSSYISAEMGLLMATRVELEAQESSKFRAFSTRLRASGLQQQKAATRLKLLDQCSIFDHETSWKQLRKIGNTTCLANIAEYNAWKEKSLVSASTLVLTGKLGCGKSVVFASMVEDLATFLGDKCASLAYFFCRHDVPNSLMARVFIGSLIRQIVCSFSDFSSATWLCQKTCLDYDDMAKLLGDILPSGHTVYLLIDGLDACSEAERSEAAREFRQLQAIFPVSICISYRLEPDTDWKWIPTEFPFATKVALPSNNSDIESFIQTELESCLEKRSLVVGDPTLILDTQDSLLEGSQGMFLWVHLQLKALCSMSSDDEIRQALVNLPQDLRDLYSQILRKSKQSQESFQRRVLELVLVARQPLTVEQMREALSVTPGDTDWQTAKLLNKVYSVLSSCGALLTIDEEDLTVRVVHPSVTQFLLDSSAGNVSIGQLQAQATMADILATYLSYGVFGTELSAAVVPRINGKAMPAHVVDSTLTLPSNVQKLALKLLKARRQQDFDIGQILAQTRQSSRHPRPRFHLYEYAKAYGVHHTLSANNASDHVNKLLPVLLHRKSFDLSTNAPHLQDANLLHIAAQYDNMAVFEMLLRLARDDEIDESLLNGYTPLMVAADAGSTQTTALLLATGKVNLNAEDLAFQTPLMCATSRGHLEIVELLVKQRDTRFHSPLNSKRTALTVAIESSQHHVLEYLLSVERGFTKGCYTDALRVAVEALNRNAVELLLVSGKLRSSFPGLDSTKWVEEVAGQLGLDASFTQLVELGNNYCWDLSSRSRAPELIEQARCHSGGVRGRRNAIVDWHMINFSEEGY